MNQVRRAGATICVFQRAVPCSRNVNQRWISNEKEKTRSKDSFDIQAQPPHKDQKHNGEYLMHHPIWKEEDLNVEITHVPPTGISDRLAYWTIQLTRWNFDVISGYKFGKHNEHTWLNRMIFLETVAGVPGSIGGTLRHLASLRRLKRDNGWIHTLLSEAENERMHLLTFLKLKNPGRMFRLAVMISQGIFYNFFFVSYLISSRFCHRLVGYLEEEAVKTYTHALDEIAPGKSLEAWVDMPAPDIAKKYWKLKDDATMKDTILVIRADEGHHRDVNHTLGQIASDDTNPFALNFKE